MNNKDKFIFYVIKNLNLKKSCTEYKCYNWTLLILFRIVAWIMINFFFLKTVNRKILIFKIIICQSYYIIYYLLDKIKILKLVSKGKTAIFKPNFNLLLMNTKLKGWKQIEK